MAGPARQRTDSRLIAHIAAYHTTRGDLDAAHAVLAPLLLAPPIPQSEQGAVGAVWCDLARTYVRRGALEPAMQALANARTLNEGIDTWRIEASIAELRGETESALALWRRIAAAEPNSGTAWQALARACEAAAQTREAVEAYVKAAQVDPTHSTILRVAQSVARLTPLTEGISPADCVRIAIIGSSTLDHLQSYLEIYCRTASLTPSFYLGAFDQYAREILDPESALYTFDPEVIIVAIHGRTLFPDDLYHDPFALDTVTRHKAADAVVSRVNTLLASLTARTKATVLFHTFATPQYSPLGALDLRDGFGQSALFATINECLAERVRRDFPSVYLIDEDRMYSRIGKRNVTDPRLWSLARIGIGPLALHALAAEYMRLIKAIKGRTRKCLVLDLDNTLWGGIVGEDGYEGIAIGQDAPGNAFRAFQEVILSLWKRGIILAINSKNNEKDALDVLQRHPDMILRPLHFAAVRINWSDKASNLQSIAEELNIGLDSIVFIDDSPVECHLIRTRLPQVLTVELPTDPTRYRGMLLEMTDFDTLGLTDEDRLRGQLYARRQQRLDWEAGHAGNLDEYLADLDLVVDLALVDDFTLPRVAQLINKTNQFNLTTLRHNEATVRQFSVSPRHKVTTARVRDRFGDHGLVGVAILIQQGDDWVVDSFLLSCRVLGRGVETAILSGLVAQVREQGGRMLRGSFVPTAKNAPASDFYARHGFQRCGEHAGIQEWEINVRSDDVPPPSWLTLHVWHEALTP